MDASTFGHAVVKTTVLQVLHEHRGWLLADLGKYFDRGGPLADELGAITVGELMGLRDRRPLDPHRLERARAETLQGEVFDAVVLEHIVAAGDWVSAGYLRTRVGGPRWKLQAAFGRLAEAKSIERRGKTSNTQYRAAGRWPS